FAFRGQLDKGFDRCEGVSDFMGETAGDRLKGFQPIRAFHQCVRTVKVLVQHNGVECICGGLCQGGKHGSGQCVFSSQRLCCTEQREGDETALNQVWHDACGLHRFHGCACPGSGGSLLGVFSRVGLCHDPV